MRLSLLAAVGLLCVTASSAQADRRVVDPASVQEVPRDEIRSIIELLALEDEAADAVRAVLTVHNRKLTALRVRIMRDGDLVATEKIERILAAMDEEANEALADLLTEEQMAKYLEYRQNQRDKRSQGPY